MIRSYRYLIVLAVFPLLGGSYRLSKFLRDDPTEIATANRITMAADFRQQIASRGNRNAGQPRKANNQDLTRSCRIQAGHLKQAFGDRLQVITCPPFVVGGFESLDTLRNRCEQTVLPATESMLRRFDWRVPDQVVTILVFPDEQTYRDAALARYQITAPSIYGFYLPTERTILVNLAAGSGTIMHELTHALLDFEPAEYPVWFHEGLASCHEECQLSMSSAGPVIEPRDNWRLDILSLAMQRGSITTIRDLLNESAFRGRTEACDYAMARYLCMFLDEQGVLAEFYGRWRADLAHDASGYATLQSIWASTERGDLDLCFRDWVRRRAADRELLTVPSVGDEP